MEQHQAETECQREVRQEQLQQDNNKINGERMAAEHAISAKQNAQMQESQDARFCRRPPHRCEGLLVALPPAAKGILHFYMAMTSPARASSSFTVASFTAEGIVTWRSHSWMFFMASRYPFITQAAEGAQVPFSTMATFRLR